ncbi:MAG TPA: hypothetical protein VML00_07155 [Bacteroidota bacterium]|nr:hypothetical protein [Bacteroidota bacterium]
MNQPTMEYTDDPIPQNHERGPGWFLRIAYVVIALSCIYYLFTNWNWKSNYQEQQEKIRSELGR